jgi:hypothetical protein
MRGYVRQAKLLTEGRVKQLGFSPKTLRNRKNRGGEPAR